MFDDDEWLELVRKLAALTEAEAVKWAIAANGNLSVSLRGYQYEIGSVDNDGRQPYFLAVNQLVQDEPWSETELARLEAQGNDRFSDAQKELVGLQRLAFRSAHGGPQLFAKLLSDMEEILPTPPKKDLWSTGETPF